MAAPNPVSIVPLRIVPTARLGSVVVASPAMAHAAGAYQHTYGHRAVDFVHVGAKTFVNLRRARYGVAHCIIVCHLSLLQHNVWGTPLPDNIVSLIAVFRTEKMNFV